MSKLKGCKLVGKVVKVQGECVAGHRVGEEFDFTLFSEEKDKIHRTPNICGFLYDALFPYLVTLQFGGSFPWEEDKDKFTMGCPDNHKVVVEIRRVKE
ncbi:MAG: TIGR04076 family protein [Candidatus Bathyarchaeia archaeon]